MQKLPQRSCWGYVGATPRHLHKQKTNDLQVRVQNSVTARLCVYLYVKRRNIMMSVSQEQRQAANTRDLFPTYLVEPPKTWRNAFTGSDTAGYIQSSNTAVFFFLEDSPSFCVRE